MEWKRTIQLVEAHCEGEVGVVITSGPINIPGSTMQEKMRYINDVDSSLIRFILFEPRGCAQRTANLVLPPNDPNVADIGFIPLLPTGAQSMSGSNCMCVVTVLLETGLMEMKEPTSTVRLDTPAGIVEADAECRNGKVERVILKIPDSFVYNKNGRINVKTLGTITADIAFGGVFYVLVDVNQIGLHIEPQSAHLLASAGITIKEAFSSCFDPVHPVIQGLTGIESVLFYEKLSLYEVRTCNVGATGRVDRSPCGTGSSALAASMWSNGDLKIGDTLTFRSIIDSKFEVQCLDKTQVGEIDAIRCSVSGRSWIFGIHQIGLDPRDPFGSGFMLSDTWGQNIAAAVHAEVLSH